MENSENHDYHDTSLGRHRRVVSDGSLTLAVTPRSSPPRDPKSTFDISDPIASQGHDLVSIGREALRHIFALIRLAFRLWTLPLKPASKIYYSLNDLLFLLLESTLRVVPNGSQLITVTRRSRSQWPTLSRLASRAILSPLRLVQSFLGFQHGSMLASDPAMIDGNIIELDDQVDCVVTVRFVRHNSRLTAPSWCSQNQCSSPHAIYNGSQLPNQCSTFSQKDDDSPQSIVIHKHISGASAADRNDEPPDPRLDGSVLEACRTRCAASKLAELDSPDGARSSPESPVGIRSRKSKSGKSSKSRSMDPNQSQQAIGTLQRTTMRAGSQISSGSSDILSDPTGAESFSPEPLWLPQIKSTESYTGFWNPSSHSVQAMNVVGQSSKTPALGPDPGSHLYQPADDRETIIRSTRTQVVNSNQTKAEADPFQDKPNFLPEIPETICSLDGANYFRSQQSSRHKESPTMSTPNSREDQQLQSQHLRQQQKQREEGDCKTKNCGKTPSISCEACNRRHERFGRTRIPRRVVKPATKYHLSRPRSASPGTGGGTGSINRHHHNFRHSTGSTQTVVARRKGQRGRAR